MDHTHIHIHIHSHPWIQLRRTEPGHLNVIFQIQSSRRIAASIRNLEQGTIMGSDAHSTGSHAGRNHAKRMESGGAGPQVVDIAIVYSSGGGGNSKRWEKHAMVIRISRT